MGNNNSNITPFSVQGAITQMEKMTKFLNNLNQDGNINTVAFGDWNSDWNYPINDPPNKNIAKRVTAFKKILNSHNICSINQSLAPGIPTNVGFNSDSKHTNDIFLTNSNAIHKWTQMDVTNPSIYYDHSNYKYKYKKENEEEEMEEEDAYVPPPPPPPEDHYIIYAKSNIKMTSTHCDNPFYFKLNMNEQDHSCFEHFFRHVAADKIDNLKKDVEYHANLANNKLATEKILDIGQLAFTAMKIISAIRTYGIKKTSIGKPRNKAIIDDDETRKLQSMADEISINIQYFNKSENRQKAAISLTPQQTRKILKTQINKQYDEYKKSIYTKMQNNITNLNHGNQNVTNKQLYNHMYNFIKRSLKSKRAM